MKPYSSKALEADWLEDLRHRTTRLMEQRGITGEDLSAEELVKAAYERVPHQDEWESRLDFSDAVLRAVSDILERIVTERKIPKTAESKAKKKLTKKALKRLDRLNPVIGDVARSIIEFEIETIHIAAGLGIPKEDVDGYWTLANEFISEYVEKNGKVDNAELLHEIEKPISLPSKTIVRSFDGSAITENFQPFNPSIVSGPQIIDNESRLIRDRSTKKKFSWEDYEAQIKELNKQLARALEAESDFVSILRIDDKAKALSEFVRDIAQPKLKQLAMVDAPSRVSIHWTGRNAVTPEIQWRDQDGMQRASLPDEHRLALAKAKREEPERWTTRVTRSKKSPARE